MQESEWGGELRDGFLISSFVNLVCGRENKPPVVCFWEGKISLLLFVFAVVEMILV